MNYQNANNSLGHSMLGMQESAFATQAPTPSPINRLDAACDNLIKVSGLVREVAAQLCGTESESASGKDGPEPVRSHFEQIEMLASKVREYSDKIAHDISRIQSRL